MSRIEEKAEILKEALNKSAKASENFSLFWSLSQKNNNSAEKVQEYFISSQDSLREGLTCLEKRLFEKKSQRKIQALLLKGHRLLETFQNERIEFTGNSLPTDRLTQLYAYFDFLCELKKRLNRIVVDEIDYFSEYQTWRQLGSIHPDFLIKFYGVCFFLVFRMKQKTLFLLVLVVFVLVGAFWQKVDFLYRPYYVPGTVGVHSLKSNFSQAGTFSLKANEQFQELVIPLREKAKAEKISLDFYLRPGHTLELDKIVLLGNQSSVLREFDFRTSQKKRWGFINTKYVEQYQIHERGLDELEQVNLDPESEMHFSREIRRQLEPVLNIIYWDKDQFNQAVEERMDPKPNRLQGKFLRAVFQRPILRQTDFFEEKNMVLESPPLLLNQIQTIKIRARVGFLFHQTWFFGL
ncbi:MAG: hypothetical protein HQM13_16465 [SAR324 cluster bacterium]|nr:hypothetical protein [SAR324 cluster bacterium]